MKPRLLDLFCGAGGAAVGYHRAGFEVVGIDVYPQPNYPFPFIQANAMHFPVAGFQAVHASPPCQAYMPINAGRQDAGPRYIEELRDILLASGLPYVIENVPGAPLLNPVMLCGSMFGLRVLRHRLFENNWGLQANSLSCRHLGTVASGFYAAVYGAGAHGKRVGRNEYGRKVRVAKAEEGPPWSVAMGIDWMRKWELVEAIPPAYTEFIGRQLIASLAVQPELF